jgi:hypothetical protein
MPPVLRPEQVIKVWKRMVSVLLSNVVVTENIKAMDEQ